MQTLKACGDCSLCCTVLMIPELEKPKDHPCTHCTTGCSIYDHRPTPCRDFQCRWTIDAAMGPEWKPSVSGLVLVIESDKRMGIHVDPARPGAWLVEPYASTLRTMSGLWLQQGAFMFVMEQGRTTVLLPNQQIEVGDVGPDDSILLRERVGARDFFDAEVVPAARCSELSVQPGWNVVR